MKQNFSQILKLSKQLNGPVILFDSDDHPFACLPLEQLEALMGEGGASASAAPHPAPVAPEPPVEPVNEVSSAPQQAESPQEMPPNLSPASGAMDESRFYLEPID